MRTRVTSRGGALLLLVGGFLTAGGCGGGSGGSETSGEKLVSGRDISLPFFWDSKTLGYVRATADPSQPEPQDLWILDLETGTSSVALTGIDWSPPDGWPRSRAGSLLITGRGGRRFFDFATRASIDLSSFGLDQPGQPGDHLFLAYGTAGGSSYFPISLIRRDAGAVALATGNAGLVGVGWPDNLKTVTLPGSIGEMAFLGEDLAVLFAPYDAGSSSAEQKAGIYRLSAMTGELTPLVAPRPIADFSGVAGECELSGRCLFRVMGCGATDPVCPGTDKPPCVILYAVNTHDDVGTLVPHVYDVNTGTDTQLSDYVSRFTVASDQRRVLWDDQLTISLNYLDVCSGARLKCRDMPSGPVIWRPDGNGFAAVDQVNYYFGVAELVDGGCEGEWYPMAVYGVQFAPTGDGVVWVGNSPANSETPEVWMAAADGTGGAKIAEGDVFGIGYSGDGRRIYIGRGGASNAGLSWLDPDVSPPVEHLLADNYGGFSSVGSERVLLIDHWNSQDGSGELTLIDIDKDERQRIARAVTDMTTAGSIDGDGLNIAYTVRTRVSSDRDGLWLTTLP
jgi:hypothetical protein